MKVCWLLFRHSGKRNRNRLVLTGAAVALGVLMILLFIAGVNALFDRSERTDWRLNFFNNETTTKPIEGVEPLEVALAFEGNLNKYENETIDVVAMRATGPSSPRLNGMPPPEAGEYYVSQALFDIMQNNPEDNIGSRFGDTLLGIIPDRYVASPDSLDVVRGMSAGEGANPRVSRIYRFDTGGGLVPYDGFLAVLLLCGAAILFVPIIVFLTIATQLGSVQREQRYAALRLVGATRRQITRIIAFESSMAALGGIVLGTVLFPIARVPLKGFHFDGLRFWPEDIGVSAMQYIGIVGMVLVLCIVANWWGMRRVQVSPLGVAHREMRAKRARPVRLAPLALGLGVFAWLATAGKSWVSNDDNGAGPFLVLLMGVFLIMVGLLVAGPYLTRVVAWVVGRRARSAPTLIAAKRVETQFWLVFRSVSGVVLALFAGSFYLTAVSGIGQYNRDAVNDNGYSQLRPDTALVLSSGLPEDFATLLEGLDYVVDVQPVVETANGSALPCRNVSHYTKLSCGGLEGYAVIDFGSPVVDRPVVEGEVEPIGSPGYALTWASNADIDRLRSFVAANEPTPLSTPGGTYVVSGTYAQQAVTIPIVDELASLAYVGIGVTLLVAIASLLVATIGGLFERQRSFAMLRLSGMNVRQMKRTVVIESLFPLLSTSLLSAAIGCWIGYLFVDLIDSSLGAELHPTYFLIVGGSLILAVIAIYSVLPLLDALTRPEAIRTE